MVPESRRILSPIDRVSEVIFGLIMALTFTCTISVAEAGREEIREVLVGALTCNIAWGLVDGVMYVLTALIERKRESERAPVRLQWKDCTGAIAVFLLVTLATIPVALPFVFDPEPIHALRTSNFIAVVMLFLAGWMLGRYAGFKAWITGLSMLAIGVLLVGATIALGG